MNYSICCLSKNYSFCKQQKRDIEKILLKSKKRKTDEEDLLNLNMATRDALELEKISSKFVIKK